MNGGLVRRRVLNRSVEGEHGINTPGEKEAWDRAGTVKGRTGRGRLASSDYLDEAGAASPATPYALSDRANGDRQPSQTPGPVHRRLGGATPTARILPFSRIVDCAVGSRRPSGKDQCASVAWTPIQGHMSTLP